MGWSSPGILIGLSVMICILLNWNAIWLSRNRRWVFPRSIGEAIAEHWQTALRLCARHFILQDVPVFGQHSVGDAHDIGGDPASRASSARESPMDDDKITF